MNPAVEAAEQRLEDLRAASGQLVLQLRAAHFAALERRAGLLARVVEGHTPSDKELSAVAAAEAQAPLLVALQEDIRVLEAQARLQLAAALVADTEAQILEAGATVREIHEAHGAALAHLADDGPITATIETPRLARARQWLQDLESALAAQRDVLARRQAEVEVFEQRARQRAARGPQ
ncbi:MAG: hypothetical protein M9913_09420 [Bryobacteraceae bacterium]|nr:hypothetical protein [Solibacteraceae bacterium]MCO5351103.1 hypothetical protein [Bryobacteraceae bacterium]